MKFWMSYKGFIAVILLCLTIFCSGYFVTRWYYEEKANEAGDAAGLVNGLFSAFAFAGVIYAIFLQRHDLEMQRDELRGQKEEFQIQNETLKRQRFENTLFSMLQLQTHITNEITFSYNKTEVNYETKSFYEKKINIKGRDAFKEVYDKIHHSYKEGERISTYNGMRGLIYAEGLKGYESCASPSFFDHYFRHLYRIFKFVKYSTLIKDEDRYEYSSIVRSQLSKYELIWLYYNGLSKYGKEKFKPLIEEFALLKNLRKELLVTNLKCDDGYETSAFLNR